MIIVFPSSSGPNSFPAIVYNFSVVAAFKYAFPTSNIMTSRLFSAVTKNAIWMDLRETTLEHVNVDGGAVMSPLATNRAFRVKSIFISKIIMSATNLYSGGGLSPLFTSSKAICMFVISFIMASYQKVLPFSLSNSSASATEDGMRIPNLYPFRTCCAFDIFIKRIIFFRTCGAHQSYPGSSINRLSLAYWASSTAFVSFNSLSVTHEVDPSFHSISRSQPEVVFFLMRRPLFNKRY